MSDADRIATEARVAELSAEHFIEAAEWTAARLKERHHAYVILSPGDATAYRIMILAPDGTCWNDGVTGDHRYYHVALSYGLGLGYDWHGGHLSADYVGEKWTRREHGYDYHTACVLTRFLNLLADKIEELR